MSERLSGAYWKLWHDARGRFLIALGLILLGLLGVFTTSENHKPRACNFQNTSLSWSGMRSQLKSEMDLNKEEWQRAVRNHKLLFQQPAWAATYADIGIPGPDQLADADVL